MPDKIVAFKPAGFRIDDRYPLILEFSDHGRHIIADDFPYTAVSHPEQNPGHNLQGGFNQVFQPLGPAEDDLVFPQIGAWRNGAAGITAALETVIETQGHILFIHAPRTTMGNGNSLGNRLHRMHGAKRTAIAYLAD